MDDLVSIIMLSYNRGQYVEDSIRSVINQTYTNWELFFVDDSSTDNTIEKVLNSFCDERIHLSQYVFKQGEAVTRYKAIKGARGRWIAFMNCGDLWHPTKLEEQITFMEKNNYGFSYTKYGIIDCKSIMHDAIIGGPERICYRDMQKCCWPGYLTVMYDAEKVGQLKEYKFKENNDYAIWLEVCKKEDCYLLNKNLATQRTDQRLYSPFPLFKRLAWRYDVFSIAEKKNPIMASVMTVRSMWYGIVKRVKYIESNGENCQ